MAPTTSNLLPALDRITRNSARGMLGRARMLPPGLNRYLDRALAAAPGTTEALVADPVFEIAKSWRPAEPTFGDLAPGLLSADLIDALDRAQENAMPRGKHPHAHQLAAWQASLKDGHSVLVTAGTGAGKTECFLIPILQDILANPRPGGGVRAILLYPLNALIESQRERLAAWVAGLGGKVRFALLNGETEETEYKAAIKSDRFELRSREAIRKTPPEILVTNITMLEYLLLRAQDRRLLDASQGALRWIVLDEAHGYVGSQAAEMALLLRRVRAGFGVGPSDVRLMATSATIGGEAGPEDGLRSFAAALAGQPESRVTVVKGIERTPEFPAPSADTPLDTEALAGLSAVTAGPLLVRHPRVQALRKTLAMQGASLTEIAQILWRDSGRRHDAARFLDIASGIQWAGGSLLPWRAHLFHRAQGGLWACVDPDCPYRAPELVADGAGWPFGAVFLSARSVCGCGAPVYEITRCTDCGTVHLQGRFEGGAQPRLLPPDPGEGDDFALDGEPEDDDEAQGETGIAWLAPGSGIWLDDSGRIYDNAAPESVRSRAARLILNAEERGCCAQASRAYLMGFRFGPAFLMGTAMGGLLDDLAPPADAMGLPAGGRRALTFSDSRQGVARLSAKLQQDSERSLTRAFLWHAVQEGEAADPEKIAQLRRAIEVLRGANLDDMADDKEQELARLTGATAPQIRWRDLVVGLAGHTDLHTFAGDIWAHRQLGQSLVDKPENLAEMFLYRELFRRPRIQNNPETMGLLRLTFPGLANRATTPPRPLAEAGLDAEGWLGLAQAAVDMVFRQSLAVDMPDWMIPLVAPRYGVPNRIVASTTRPSEMPPNSRRWPDPRTERSRLVTLLYALTGGSPASAVDQDRVGEVLEALWTLIAGAAARDAGQGGWRLDFSKAAVERLDKAWICPVTRRPYGYSLSGLSPNDPSRRMETVEYPRLPLANKGGLTRDQRAEIEVWTESDARVGALRRRGLWSDLHDRLATFPPYVRAQEHSAQIERRTLKRYEGDFNAGRINLLNCSTTMEMGVDIADVRLVVNSNVPPALSNYRQRVGRAGRRGEPWAFALTFCRDLPLDRRVFDRPAEFLRNPILAPRVWFDSPSLIQRHVNAALLSAWLGEQGGQDVRGSIGAFMGAGTTSAEAVVHPAPVDAFLADLDRGWSAGQAAALAHLVSGTALDGNDVSTLAAATRESLDTLVRRWRTEHRTLLEGAEAADAEIRTSLELRAKRLAGEFLLGELARRGFTPAYGFPTDVVTFFNLAHRVESAETAFSHVRKGTASRQLDQALREYAPGAEVVIDGLVHQSEGILPAWQAGADASQLEDLRDLWDCPACHAFGLATQMPDVCPYCAQTLHPPRKVLRPTGFLGARPPHVGYENLSHVAPDPVRLSAQGASWMALPPGAGRMRANAEGQSAVSSGGRLGGGLAVCLDCGRAEAMEAEQHGIPATLPMSMRTHRPLYGGRRLKLTRDGLCPSSSTPHRIQRHVHLAQVTRTDVWEWQLADGAEEPAARALAAALREALAERLGVEPDEIGPSAARSTGPANQACVSVFLHDRAAGGAGLSSRMAEPEMLAQALGRAVRLLDCPEECRRGCPACILRPDLNQRDTALDRPGALALAQEMQRRLTLAEELQVLGPGTHLAPQPADVVLATRLRAQTLRSVDVFLHGEAADWDLSAWPLRRLLPRMAEAGIAVRLHMTTAALSVAGLNLPSLMALHTIGQTASLHSIDTLPLAGAFPVILRIEGPQGAQSLAVTEASEAVPGDGWGLGARAPAVVGPAAAFAPASRLSVERLAKAGYGNARMLYPARALDGAARGFGNRFWAWISQHAVLEVAALRAAKVKRVTYTDRYLLQPYVLKLAAEVMAAAPGAKAAQHVISLAVGERPPLDPRHLHDGFPSDVMRVAVMRALLPGADVTLHGRQMLPHHRALMLDLNDGRRLTLYLDQGFGSWRVTGQGRHEFAATADRQARALDEGRFDVSGPGATEAPISLTFS